MDAAQAAGALQAPSAVALLGLMQEADAAQDVTKAALLVSAVDAAQIADAARAFGVAECRRQYELVPIL